MNRLVTKVCLCCEYIISLTNYYECNNHYVKVMKYMVIYQEIFKKLVIKELGKP